MAGNVVNCRIESRDENSTGELEMSMKRLFDLIHLRITTLLTKRRFIGMCGALFLLVCCLGRRVTAQSQNVTLVGAADIGGRGPAADASVIANHQQAAPARLGSVADGGTGQT